MQVTEDDLGYLTRSNFMTLARVKILNTIAAISNLETQVVKYCDRTNLCLNLVEFEVSAAYP